MQCVYYGDLKGGKYIYNRLSVVLLSLVQRSNSSHYMHIIKCNQLINIHSIISSSNNNKQICNTFLHYRADSMHFTQIKTNVIVIQLKHIQIVCVPLKVQVNAYMDTRNNMQRYVYSVCIYIFIVLMCMSACVYRYAERQQAKTILTKTFFVFIFLIHICAFNVCYIIQGDSWSGAFRDCAFIVVSVYFKI